MQLLKNIIICLSTLCSVLCVIPSLANITYYRFYADQVYDVQRSPAFPIANNPFTLTYFRDPYREAKFTSYRLNDREYIQLFFVGGTCKDGLVGINRYNDRGDLLETVQSRGHIYALTREGFLHDNDNNIGTFISTHHFLRIDNLTYLSPTGPAPENCTTLEYY